MNKNGTHSCKKNALPYVTSRPGANPVILRYLVFLVPGWIGWGGTAWAQEQPIGDSLDYFYSTPALADDSLQALSLEKVIRQALEKNHNLIIARNNEEVANNNTSLGNAQRNLNVLRGQAPSDTFRPVDDFDINRHLVLDRLLKQTQQNNAALRLAEYNLRTSQLDEKVARASYLPSLNLTGSYGYLRQENDASFLLLQEQLGFTGGVSLNYTLFDTTVRSTQTQNATIAVENQEQSQAQTRLSVQRDLLNAYATYENSLYLLDKEQDNLETAQLNFERSETALQLGQINATAFRDAQLNLIRARQRINALLLSGETG